MFHDKMIRNILHTLNSFYDTTCIWNQFHIITYKIVFNIASESLEQKFLTHTQFTIYYLEIIIIYTYICWNSSYLSILRKHQSSRFWAHMLPHESRKIIHIFIKLKRSLCLVYLKVKTIIHSIDELLYDIVMFILF